MPRVVDAGQRREEVAEAVRRVIIRNGVTGTTLRDVAGEAGYSTGVLTHYFPDKAALLLFALQATTGRVAERIALIDPNERGALRALIEEVLPLDETRTVNWLVWLAFWGEATGDPALAATQREHYRHFRARCEEMIATALARGEIAPGLDAADEADRIVALVDGLALQAVFDRERWPAERQRRFTDAHLASLVNRV